MDPINKGNSPWAINHQSLSRNKRPKKRQKTKVPTLKKGMRLPRSKLRLQKRNRTLEIKFLSDAKNERSLRPFFAFFIFSQSEYRGDSRVTTMRSSVNGQNLIQHIQVKVHCKSHWSFRCIDALRFRISSLSPFVVSVRRVFCCMSSRMRSVWAAIEC